MTREDFNNKMVDFLKHPSERKVNELFEQVVPHWISVEDELPKEHFKDSSSKWVLVCTPLGSVYIDSYNHKKKEWVNNRKSVTHWMPLPSVEHLRESTKMIEKGGAE